MTILRYFEKMYTINFYMLVYVIRTVLNILKKFLKLLFKLRYSK